MQEVIVQNFRAKPGTKMAHHPEPSLDELLWTARTAREVLPADVHVQVPPNLSYDDFPRLLEAGIDDWGGVSPVTIDHVNPEAPWPEIERLRAATEGRGFELAARLPIYPEYVADLERWADPRVAHEIRRHADASGLAREDAVGGRRDERGRRLSRRPTGVLPRRPSRLPSRRSGTRSSSTRTMSPRSSRRAGPTSAPCSARPTAFAARSAGTP